VLDEVIIRSVDLTQLIPNIVANLSQVKKTNTKLTFYQQIMILPKKKS